MAKEALEQPVAGRWQRLRFDRSPLHPLDNLAAFSGNYIVFLPNGQIYVGESTNVRKRLHTHVKMARYSHVWQTRWGSFGELEIAVRKERHPFERLMVEGWFISRLKSSLNKIKRSFKFYHG